MVHKFWLSPDCGQDEISFLSFVNRGEILVCVTCGFFVDFGRFSSYIVCISFSKIVNYETSNCCGKSFTFR